MHLFQTEDLVNGKGALARLGDGPSRWGSCNPN